MSRLQLACLLAASVLNTGCAHKFYSAEFDPETWAVKGDKVPGVVYYEPAYVKITHSFTQLTDDKGKVVGKAPGGCTVTTQKEEIVLMTNLRKPRILINEPGALAAGHLKVTLTNGMLGGVDAASTSQFVDLVEKTGAVFAPAIAGEAGPTAACNSAPQISGFKEIDLGSQ